MDKNTTGWILFIAAVGMMCGLMSADVARLTNWSQLTTPMFISSLMAHLAAVIMAFIGGKIIPDNRSPFERTRTTDPSVK